jgi:hypothetical protein
MKSSCLLQTSHGYLPLRTQNSVTALVILGISLYSCGMDHIENTAHIVDEFTARCLAMESPLPIVGQEFFFAGTYLHSCSLPTDVHVIVLLFLPKYVFKCNI